MSMGSRIKELRKQAGLNQTELGELIGQSHAAVAAIESGRNDPSTQTLEKIATKFNVTIDYIVRGKIERNNLAADEIEVINLMRNDNEAKKAFVKVTLLKKKALSELINYAMTA
jgi:transcriptional regulator with XRE-family HTH domain